MSSARARLLAAGMSAEKIDAALGSSSGPARGDNGQFVPPRVPVQDHDDVTRLPVSPDVLGMNDQQTLSMARALEKAGVDPERIRGAMAADGYKEVPETLTPAQVEHNKQWGLANLPDASQYKPNFRTALGDGIREYTPVQLAEFRSEAGEWASKLALPVKLAESLIERSLHVWDALERMPPGQRTTWAQEQRSQLMRAGGQPATTAVAVLKLAPGAFHDRLMASGALNDAFILKSLANWGSHLSRYQTSKKS